MICIHVSYHISQNWNPKHAGNGPERTETTWKLVIVAADKVRKGHGNGERPSVHLRFPTIIWKNNHSVNFKFDVCIFGWVFRIDSLLGNVGPLVAKNWLKMGQNGGFQPLSEKVFIHSNSNLWCTLVGWVFRIDSLLAHIGQILAL